MITHIHAFEVTLRGGLTGWLEHTLPDDQAPWRFQGHICHPGAQTSGPHQWTAEGRWLDDKTDHDYDIVEGLPESVAATSEEGTAP